MFQTAIATGDGAVIWFLRHNLGEHVCSHPPKMAAAQDSEQSAIRTQGRESCVKRHRF